MLEKLLGGLTLAEQSVPNGFVVALGVGVVFLGLVSIVLICKIMSAIIGTNKKTTEEVNVAPAAPVVPAVIENKQEIIAAVSAVIAEELGTDVSALRIHSFKKL